MSQSLHAHQNAWQQLHRDGYASRWHLDAVEHGVRLPLTGRPPRVRLPNRPLSAEHTAFVDAEIQRLLNEGAMEEAAESDVWISSPLGVVPKASGKLRMIIDMRLANKYVDAPTFRYEDVDAFLPLIENGDHAYTLDLKAAFHHIVVHKQHRPLLGCQWRGRLYRFRVLPFGCSASPYLLTSMLKPTLTKLRDKYGARIAMYMDDLAGLVRPGDTTARDNVVATLNSLGWVIEHDKSVLDPAPRIQFLGFEIFCGDDNGPPSIRCTAKRRRNTLDALRRIMRARRVTARQAARVAGLCTSMARGINVPVRSLLGGLFEAIRTAPTWDAVVQLPEHAYADLAWFRSALSSWQGQRLHTPPADLHIYTDASGSGWGATAPFDDTIPDMAGFWQHGAAMSSNMRELSTVLLALQQTRSAIAGRNIHVFTDNVVSAAYVNRFGGRARHLDAVARKIFELISDAGCTVRASYTPGLSNDHITRADELSRLNPKHEWELTRAAFDRVNRAYGPLVVDRFATRDNAKLPTFNTRYYDPQANGTDALSCNWANDDNYLAPPVRLIPRVLRHAQVCGAGGVLIAPIWRSAPWWPVLKSMTVSSMPLTRSDLMPGAADSEPRNHRWKWAAFRITCNSRHAAKN